MYNQPKQSARIENDQYILELTTTVAVLPIGCPSGKAVISHITVDNAVIFHFDGLFYKCPVPFAYYSNGVVDLREYKRIVAVHIIPEEINMDLSFAPLYAIDIKNLEFDRSGEDIVTVFREMMKVLNHPGNEAVIIAITNDY